MRIGIFSESYAPLLNGVAVSIGTLIQELTREGHDVFVFAAACRNHKDADDRTFRFPSFFTPIDPSYPVPVPYFPGLTATVRSLDLDVIHTQTPWLLGWIGLKLGRRLGIPVVSTNHTQYAEYVHYFPFAPREAKRSFIIGLLRRYYNRVDGVVAPSRLVSTMLRDFGVTKPVYVIPTGNALDTAHNEDSRRLVRSENEIPEDATVLLYVGRLAREKNLDLLLDSFDRLAREHPSTYLLVAGGGPYEAGCRRFAAQLTSSSRVVFTGAVPREEVARYYSAGDVFVFPSTTETQGLVLAEALAAGLPCIAIRAGGSQEVLMEGQDSLLAENNVESFSATIDLLLRDPSMRSEFSARAAANAKRYTPAEMASRMIDVYESAIARHNER